VAVARGLGRADAPARRGGARVVRLRRPQQHERQAGVAGREMQPLAGLEIEPGRGAGDRGRHARAQRLLHGPQRLLVVSRLDQDQPGRIEAELPEAVAMRTTVIGERAGRGDEQQWSRCGMKPREQRDEKAERGGRVAMLLRRDLMQGAGCEAAVRQMRVERVETERKNVCRAADALQARQQAAQRVDDRGAVSACEGQRRGGHGYAVRTNSSDP